MNPSSSTPSESQDESSMMFFNTDLTIAMVAKKQNKPRKKKSTPQKRKSHKKPIQKKENTAMRDFVNGAFLYGLCLTLPAILGMLMRVYEANMLGRHNEYSSEESIVGYYKGMLSNYLCETWNWSDRCAPKETSVYDVENDGFNENFTNTTHQQQYHDYQQHMASDTSVLSDGMLVTVLSLSMAFLRILCVHLLVPKYLETPQRLEALVRCKSTHLLSSSYDLTLTPKASSLRNVIREVPKQPQEEGKPLLSPPLLPLDNDGVLAGQQETIPIDTETMPSIPNQEQQQQQQHNVDEHQKQHQESEEKDWIQKTKDMLHTGKRNVSRSSLLALGHEPTQQPQDNPVHHQDKQDSPQGHDNNTRLFAAPRYATAVFRLLYSATSCTCALLWFRHANFWPIYVGGRIHQSTRHCWDLKGGFGGNVDVDFDDMNSLLRTYFILQASYHLHSLCFHILSLAILIIQTIKKSEQQHHTNWMPSIKRGFSKSFYWTSLTQHFIAIVCLVTCYFFSSLRRLGAVGMFALDVSSFFLHLLQVCINAPTNSFLRSKILVLSLLRGLVIPIYLYTRFFAIPFVVWYSAVFESKDWLHQVEQTLFPGCALYAKILFCLLLVLVTVLHFVRFRRLLYHPHLARIIGHEKQD